MKTYVWLIRREFWENRAIWMLPVVIGAALTLACLFGRMQIGIPSSPEGMHAASGIILFVSGAVFFVVMNVYASWYLVDCLHADRKDRSILFWKSLPVSDTATVLAKLFTGLVAIPLVYFAAADVSTVSMAVIVSVRAGSVFGSALWQPDLWLQMQVLWLYLIVTTAIWYLPFAGYLLVISAWAQRAVMLWTILPPLALYLLERWYFGTHYVGSLLQDRTVGYLPAAFHDFWGQNAGMTMAFDGDSFKARGSVWGLINPVGFVSIPATWIGLLIGTAFIVVAVQLRMRRTEM